MENAQLPAPLRGPARRSVTRARRLRRAERGRFVINGKTVTLQPPVDWTMNPQHARSFAHNLFKFQWIDPLIYAYRTDGDVEALQQATDLVLDFARANPPDGDPVDPDIWDDKRTGDRGPYLAYIMRAAQCEGLLDSSERSLLLALMQRHVNVLTYPATVQADQPRPVRRPRPDAARPPARLAARLRGVGRPRPRALRGDPRRQRSSPTRGSGSSTRPATRSSSARTLQRFLQVPGNESPELAAILRRMQDVVGWLREPDGKIPQWGDSDLKTVPTFGVKRCPRRQRDPRPGRFRRRDRQGARRLVRGDRQLLLGRAQACRRAHLRPLRRGPAADHRHRPLRQGQGRELRLRACDASALGADRRRRGVPARRQRHLRLRDRGRPARGTGSTPCSARTPRP